MGGDNFELLWSGLCLIEAVVTLLPVTFSISLARALASARRASSVHASRNARTLPVVGLVLFSAMNLPLEPASEICGTNCISGTAHPIWEITSYTEAIHRLVQTNAHGVDDLRYQTQSQDFMTLADL